jgi:hypothetical protein
MPKPDSPPAGKSNKFVYDTSAATGKPLTTHQWYDGTQHPWEFKRVWHLEPSLTNPDEVYAGVEDAALFRSTDGAHRHVVPPSSVRNAPDAEMAMKHPLRILRIQNNRMQNTSRRRRVATSALCRGRGVPRPPARYADQPRPALAIHSRPECRDRPLRSPHRHASRSSRRLVHAKTLGRYAQ